MPDSEVKPTLDDQWRRARQTAAARYNAARPLLRQALDLGATYAEDGAWVTAYSTVLRACTTILEKEAQADPPMGALLAASVRTQAGLGLDVRRDADAWREDPPGQDGPADEDGRR